MGWFWHSANKKAEEMALNKELEAIAIYTDDKVDFNYTILKSSLSTTSYLENEAQYQGDDSLIAAINRELRKKALALGADCLINVKYNLSDAFANANTYTYVSASGDAVKINCMQFSLKL